MVGRTVDERDGPSARLATSNGARGQPPFKRTRSWRARIRAWRFTRHTSRRRGRTVCVPGPTADDGTAATHPPPTPPLHRRRRGPGLRRAGGPQPAGGLAVTRARPRRAPKAGQRVGRARVSSATVLETNRASSRPNRPATHSGDPGSTATLFESMVGPPGLALRTPSLSRPSTPSHRPRLAGQASNPCRTRGQDTLRSVQVAPEDEPVAAINRLSACTCRETMAIRDDPHAHPSQRRWSDGNESRQPSIVPKLPFFLPIPRPTDFAESHELNDRTAYVAQVVRWPAHDGKIRTKVCVHDDKMRTMEFSHYSALLQCLESFSKGFAGGYRRQCAGTGAIYLSGPSTESLADGPC